MQSLQQYFLLIKLSKDCSFHEIALHKFCIDLSQNLTPEPSPTKTLSDIINCQLQQSLNPKVSIHTILKAFHDTCNPLEVIQVAPEPLLDQLSRFV